jgi:predicted nucleotidyltransferase
VLELIQKHRSELFDLCRRFGVRRLDLFGSAARGEFKNNSSDLDFLVLFDRNSGIDPSEQYFGLLSALELLFGRKVDLVDVRAHRNPYFMAEALKHREMLYVA